MGIYQNWIQFRGHSNFLSQYLFEIIINKKKKEMVKVISFIKWNEIHGKSSVFSYVSSQGNDFRVISIIFSMIFRFAFWKKLFEKLFLLSWHPMPAIIYENDGATTKYYETFDKITITTQVWEGCYCVYIHECIYISVCILNCARVFVCTCVCGCPSV